MKLKPLFLSISILTLIPCISNATNLSDYIDQFKKGEGAYISSIITNKARKYNLDPLFLASVFYIESRYDNNAVSSAGARGIAQLMPDTANYLEVNPYDPEDNIEGGAKYLREMIDLHQNKGVYKYNYALASYNAGPGATSNSIPTYTYDYIQMVSDEYHKLNTIIDRINPPIKNNSILENKKKTLLLQLYKLKQLKSQKSKK